MKLNRLSLQGFKSFADPTEFVFDKGLTVLVGPNGCGKSNIVDALKWVLGDRSAKSLRGEEMLDVIFSGSNGRPNANYAEVNLSFSNEDHKLPIDYDEVTITRRLFRSGESEYLINQQACRLRDIKELFMDTGIGMGSYSIIEQRKVDFILQASPRERRSLFDEAAGISKYKARRKETESKLERVQQDLLRLHDVIREVKSGIRSIKLQATKAGKYKRLLEEVRLKKTQLLLHQYHDLVTQQNQFQATNTQLIQQQTDLQTNLKDLEDNIIRLEKEIIRQDNQAKTVQGDLMSLVSRIAEGTNELNNLQRENEELNTSEANAQQQLATLTQQATDNRNRLCEVMQFLESVRQEVDTRANEIEEAESQLTGLKQELANLQQTQETQRNKILEETHKRAQYQNELIGIQTELKSLSTRRTKSELRSQETKDELTKMESQESELTRKHQDIIEQINLRKQESDQNALVVNSLSQDSENITSELNQEQGTFNKAHSRKEVLEDLELHNEGLETGVKAVIEYLKKTVNEPDSSEDDSGISRATIYGLLADLIEVDPPYVLVIESILKDLAQALVTSDISSSLSVIKFVKSRGQGRITTIAVEAIKDFFELVPTVPIDGPAILGWASDFVKTSDQLKPVLEALLGRYLIVENFEIAQRLVRTMPAGIGLATLSGEVILPEGIVAGGAAEPGLGLLSRKSELKRLSEELGRHQERLTYLTRQQKAKQQEINQQQEQAQYLRNAIYEHNIAKLEVERKQEEFKRRQDILIKEQEIVELELTEVNNQINSLAERAVSVDEVIKGLNNSLERDEAELKEFSRTIQEYTDKQAVLIHTITEKKVLQAQAVEKKEHLANQQIQFNRDIRQSEQSLEATAQNINELKDKIVAQAQTAQVKAQAMEVLKQEQVSLQEKMRGTENTMNESRTGLATQKEEEIKTKTQFQQLENTLNDHRLQEQGYKLKIENLEQKNRDENNTDLREVYEQNKTQLSVSLASGDGENNDAVQNQSDTRPINTDELAREIEEKKAQLDKMTDVNLAAIDQLNGLEERSGTLTVQEKDLIKAKESLQALIRRLNHDSREKFDATFQKIQENFNLIFRKLFGGGKAHLEMVEVAQARSTEPEQDAQQPAQPVNHPGFTLNQNGAGEEEQIEAGKRNDPLEFGVEIIAKPPGKDAISIKQLSGGEMVMTAFALTMAIFKLQPSPFCVLDEVDAALDENNVDRFTALVKEYLATTQFIIITHNKKTMMAAHVLYGLTMQKAGISKKISVKMLDEIEPLLAKEPVPIPV